MRMLIHHKKYLDGHEKRSLSVVVGVGTMRPGVKDLEEQLERGGNG